MTGIQPAVQAAVSGGLITHGNHLCTWPTGTGKTHLSLQAAAHETARGGKVIVLLPLRALASEVRSEWAAQLNVPVEAYTSDTPGARRYASQSVLIMTPERLDLITRNWRRHHHWLAQVSLIVIDELHLMGADLRGARVDAALTRLRALCPLLRITGLSATVGDPATVADWLGARHWDGADRPVPLHWHAHEVRRPQDKVKILSTLVTTGTMIFVNSRQRAQEYAQDLTDSGCPAEAHHAGLTAPDRAAREARFRAGETRALISTGTLEMGLNLPCRTVILADLSRYDRATGRMQLLSHVTLWQSAGRAGRDRTLPRADVHLLTLPSEREAARHVPDGNFEPLRSPLFQPTHLLDFVLGSVDAGMARTPTQLTRLLGRTFAAHTGHTDVTQAITDLTDQGALDVQDGALHVTPLGRAASQALLPVAALRPALSLTGEEWPFDLLLTLLEAAQTPGVDLTLPQHPGDNWAQETVTDHVLRTVPSAVIDARSAGLSSLPFDTIRAAIVIRDACTVGDTDAAANARLYEPVVTDLRETCARLAQAWSALRPDMQRLKLLSASLSAAVPYEQASLTLLSGVGGALTRRLAGAGVTDIEQLATLDPAALHVPGLSAARLTRLNREAQALVKTFEFDVTSEGPRRDRERFCAVDPDWPAHLCMSRLRRAADLHVTWHGEWAEVTGGAQPHRTDPHTCDCPDHRADRPCKHRLAVLLSREDPSVLKRAAQLIGTDQLMLAGWLSPQAARSLASG